MNESDKQLLELAAQAAGYKVARLTDDGTALLLDGVQRPWNPLHENPHSDCMGDALRLAVRIGIVVAYERNTPPELGIPRVCAMAVTPAAKWFAEVGQEDAATCRAIVRAAAEIGKGMA